MQVVAQQWSGQGPAEPRKGGGAEAGPLELANPQMEEPGRLPSKRRKIKFKKLFTYIYPLNSCLQTLDGGI